MSSACKKLQGKRSLIKLLQKDPKQSKNHHNEDKLKTISTEKEKKKSHVTSASKTKRAKDEMKDLLKESYIYVKEENESLVNKLRRKMRKIQQMKEIIKNYEDKIQEYEEVIGIIKQERPTSKSKSAEQSLRSSRKYEEIIKQSKQLAKISIEKYKRIEKEMEEQKMKYQQQISKLKETNESLKQEIAKAKLDYSEFVTSKKKMKQASKSLEKEAYQNENLCLQLKILKEKEQSWLIKQQELKRMLSQINSKINNFEVNCLLTEEKAKKYKRQLEHLRERYELKCRKDKQANEKWYNIFKQFMKETQSMGKDIQNVEKLFMQILKECLNKQNMKRVEFIA